MTSLKKRIAVLAVSLPLAASAQQAAAPAAAAPAPLYQIYGTLNLNAQYVEVSKPFAANGSTSVAGRVGVSTDSSNVGIRGTADIGTFGLGVVYQCETSAALDGDGIQGLCNRNSRLGATSAVGTLFYGNWDSPYKAAAYGTRADDAFGNTDIYDAAALMGSVGNKTKSSAGRSASDAPGASGTFNVRTANSIAYFSPKFGNMVSFKLQYGTNERASATGSFSGALYSAVVNLDMGPLSVFVADERHDDWQGLAAAGGAVAGGFVATKNTVDQAAKVGAGYELGTPVGKTTIGAVFEYLMLGYANNNGLTGNVIKSADRTGVMVNLKHRMGSHEFRARYEYADGWKLKWVGTGPKGAAGSGAQNYALGYAYYLTTAAQVYAYWTKIENERNASYVFATGGPAALTSGWNAGADPMGFGLGMRYAF